MPIPPHGISRKNAGLLVQLLFRFHRSEEALPGVNCLHWLQFSSGARRM
jgi:hypothetical protein